MFQPSAVSERVSPRHTHPAPRYRRQVSLAVIAAVAASLLCHAARADLPVLPSDYGTILYQYNPGSPKQLYIVGISHRDSLDERSCGGATVVQTQAEVYRIGEWLHRNENLELLLPEGFFRGGDRPGAQVQLVSGRDAPPLDNVALARRLSEESGFVNAEMLLLENDVLQARQVEDRWLYQEVRSGFRKLLHCRGRCRDFAALRAELRYLQSLRTAAMLQNIPNIIESEFERGTIRRQAALFTIGLDHISGIVRFLEDSRVSINVPAGRGGVQEHEMNLVTRSFGVTIILPRTLAGDVDVLQRCHLAALMPPGRV